MTATLGYDELSDALSRLGYAQNAAEYHGALCGALCVRPAEEIDPLAVLERESRANGGETDAAARLRELRGEAAESFGGGELRFAPLLPDDEEGLSHRVEALTSWCEGFLFGLSSGKPLNMSQCSAEMKEVVRDFTEFTHAGVSDDEDGEIEENAYAELVEYIRVGAQLIYFELHERAGQTATQVH